MTPNITSEDEGKQVVRGDEQIGRIVSVEHGTAYVDPDPNLTDTIKSKLGWTEGTGDEETYPLQEEAIETVTDDEVRLASGS
jgi:hypothetical protein